MLLPISTFNRPFIQDFFDHFDRVFNDVSVNGHTSFPKYNVVKDSDEQITLELALAGYSKDNVRISVQNNMLTVEGEATDNANRNYLRKDLSYKLFRKQWTLPRNVEVTNADMENGILSIQCKLNIPEEEKPKLIDIT